MGATRKSLQPLADTIEQNEATRPPMGPVLNNQPPGKYERLRRQGPSTAVLSFRVPIAERDRLEELFARHGLTLATGLKQAVYGYLEMKESPDTKGRHW